jgi:hypothetical protein
MLLVLKYGVPHRNHTRSGGPEHRRRRVRIGQVQLALCNICQEHGHTAVRIIQGIQILSSRIAHGDYRKPDRSMRNLHQYLVRAQNLLILSLLSIIE